MKRLITFFFVALPLLLACDKPEQKIVIPIPDKPSGQTGGNNGDNGTYQERIVKYLLQIGVPQKDIDDLRSIMLE